VSTFLFPDNTVLCNFAAVDRLDLLQAVLNGRGRWTAAVAYEAGRSALFLPALAGITTEGWLDEPIEITAAPDVQRVNRVRRAVFGGTDDKPLEHLGEAETCFVIKEWTAFAGSWWISDDREALRYARFQGITTFETFDLMSMAVVDGDVVDKHAFDVMMQMDETGRSLRLDPPPTSGVYRCFRGSAGRGQRPVPGQPAAATAATWSAATLAGSSRSRSGGFSPGTQGAHSQTGPAGVWAACSMAAPVHGPWSGSSGSMLGSVTATRSRPA